MSTLIDFILHLDTHLKDIITTYGFWTYLILFLIVFCETGLVVTPFLPGDSLLFTAGALAAAGAGLNIVALWLVLMAAAILGDTANYLIGAWIGPRAFSGSVRFMKKEYLERTEQFYEKYGGKTIILARFVPIVRTFAPFVAGVGRMHYGKFISYNVVGGVVWVTLFVWGGYFLGDLLFNRLKISFSLVTLIIVLLSIIPIVIEFVRARRERPAEARA